MTLCLEEVLQVAAPVRYQTTTAFGRVYQNAALGRSLLSTIELYALSDIKHLWLSKIWLESRLLCLSSLMCHI